MAAWEPYEDDLLKVAVTKYRDSRGRPMWSSIASEVPQRTYAMCRNRYARILAAPDSASIDEAGRTPNKCTACGQIKKGHTCHAMRGELDVVTVVALAEGSKLPPEELRAEEAWIEAMAIEETLCWPMEDLIAMVTEECAK